MKANKRLDKIVSYIETQGFASVKELSHQFSVSEMTIRRDLDKLVKSDHIIRTYGGGAPIPHHKDKSTETQHHNEGSTTSLDCGADVLVTASFNPKYDPIIFGSGGKPKYPIIAESVNHSSSLTCIGVDNYKAGHELGIWAGKYTLDHFDGKADVLDLSYHLPNTEARSRGFLDGLAESVPSIGNVISLNPQSLQDLAYQLTRDALEANNEINIIFAINDTNAWGAIQACIDLNIDPKDIAVISFGLEGDTIKNALKNDLYCKVSLAMFPEIVGHTCVDASILAYNSDEIPDTIETPYALITQETISDYYQYSEAGWELRWDYIQEHLELPAIHNQIQSRSGNQLPGCIGVLVPFAKHEWYQNLILSMKEYTSETIINIEVLDAEQNLKDELEFRKREIAKRAAFEIEPGNVVFLDGGIVTQYLVEFIQKKSNITIITNSIRVFNGLKDNPEIVLISTGGVFRRASQSMVGPTAESSLRDIRVDKLFLTVSGVSIDFGLSHTNVSEVTIKQAMINSAREVILLADHTKFNQESFIQIAPLSVIDTLITDNGLPASSRLQLNQAGINVIISHP